MKRTALHAANTIRAANPAFLAALGVALAAFCGAVMVVGVAAALVIR